MSSTFTLRPTERSPPGNLLEGSFRVQIAPKEFKSFGFSNGEIIRLSSVASGARGFAAAWLGSQTNAGNKPIAKVSDLLREKYGLSLHEPTVIERATEPLKPIEFIEVSYPENATAVGSYESTEELLHWIRCSLVDLDIILPGCTFDVQQKGIKSRQKNTKLRVTVDKIQPAPGTENPLYFDPIKSQVITSNSPLSNQKPAAPLTRSFRISKEGIGGLSEHIRTIDTSVAFLMNDALALADSHLLGPTAFLIHGPEGTGKSMLLNRIAQCDWQQVFTINPSMYSSKNITRDVTETFEQARQTQPSVILMDDLDRLLGKAETLVSQLRAEMGNLEGSRVVVAATARSVYDVDASLRTSSAFKTELEIFPPNAKQREDILRQTLGLSRSTSNVDFTRLAERTHGFVGRDIHKLCGLARNRRVQAIYQTLEDGNESVIAEKLKEGDFVSQEDFDDVIDQVQPTVLKDSILEVPKVRWTDIAGLDHVRELLEAITIRPYKYPDLDVKFGGPQSRKGVLLYGPPGCAKTLIAQAVATESNQNFLAVKGSELIKMYVGESERSIRDVFRRARAAKPCIIFFDEIDSIGKSREKSQDSGLNVVATLLNEMDGIEALKDVFIIGATNRPDILDSALIRTGRFDAHIHIGLPNEEARRQIIEIHTRKRPLASDVDLTLLASSTEGSSGADLKGLCAVAVEMAISDYTQHPESVPEIGMRHFERALAQHVPHTDAKEAARYEGWRPGKSLSSPAFTF
ncbi:cell division cycle protein 48 [Aaosphaeria arxii CBS 175.79]|uniref:Cell division cycle protein 48 n=1 Tax=Aaosphaeria arxii CBS 175.79 TaxID=1450172 RepID=A0A6A5Y288_9PLEO|nr:cell division cycle protein 48 [Aaosphaeria arxii CBS 175.79]KAF2019665.1 cell division cycle protein 48 [Aaosphaeria arxii CBS 175.79]